MEKADGVAAFEELVKKRFKHYFLLEPIMFDRSNIKPGASYDGMLISDDLDEFSTNEPVMSAVCPDNSLNTLACAASSQAISLSSNEKHLTPKKRSEDSDLT